MKLRKATFPSPGYQGSHREGLIQRKSGLRLLAAAGLALGAAACGPGEDETLTLGPVEGFAGLVAADEPRAALVGRDVLGNGGNAVDAAVAMFFTLGVTLPSRAGLAGGGVCLSMDNGEKTAEMLEFLPRAGRAGGVPPRGVRAMAALHARHGLNRWASLVSPAESMARFGHPISRAFARDVARGAAVIRADPELSRILRAPSGGLPVEGDRVTQPALSTVLSGLRTQGAGYLHVGAFARRFAEAASAVGERLSAEELRNAVPRFQEPAQLRFDTETLYFSAPPAADGLVAAALWGLLTEVRDYDSASAEERPHLFVEAAMRAFADRASWLAPYGESRQPAATLLEGDRLDGLMASYRAASRTSASQLSPPPIPRPEDPDGAGFAVADRWGNAVACSLTMNRLFGAGRVAEGTGLLLAARPAREHDGTLSPSVAILANEVAGDTHLAVASSGGAAAPTALVAVLLGVLVEGRPIEQAIAAPRLHHGGSPDFVLHEPQVAPAVLEALRARGHELVMSPALGRVSGFYCVEGVIDAEEGCAVGSDPRGWGLATLVQ
jgi:gamma-glutamyltranspeptidase/glutathione hydrolase